MIFQNHKPYVFSVVALMLTAMATVWASDAVANEGGDGGGEPAATNPTGPRTVRKPRTNTSSSKFRLRDIFKREEVEEAKPRQTRARRATTTRRTVRRTRRPAVRLERAASGMPPAGEARFIDNEVIVRFQRTSSARSRDRLIARLRMDHLEAKTFFLAGITVHRYRLPDGLAVRDAIASLERSRVVVNSQPNYLYTLQQDNQPKKLPQFGNDKVGLAVAHKQTKGSNARIAIIDTAVNTDHKEFSSARLTSFDVSDFGADNVDPHGTSIAGILGAGVQLTGVAPEADMISIAAFSKDASGKATGNTWTISEALNIALAEKANILNMSFAGPADPLLKRSFRGAKRRDMMPIAAAGNEGPEAATLYPAGYDTVLAVTATDKEDGIYANANAGEHIDVAAPGVGLLVLGNESGFRTSSGTSMATAYVSGIAALALSADPDLDYEALREALENGTKDLGDPGRDAVFGQGILSADAVISPLAN